MTTHKNHNQTMSELWDLLLRYRWRFIVPAFAVAALVLVASLGLPRKYRASALFERRSDLVLLEMTSRGATRSFQNPRTSLTEEIGGRPAIDQLMTTLAPRLKQEGLIASQAAQRALRDDLLRRVVIHWEIATNERDRIRVEYVGLDPRVASLVVNGLVDSYITRTRAEMESKLTKSAAFFQEKVSDHRARIEQLENQLLSFEIEHAELLPNTPNNLQAQIGLVQESLSHAMSQRDAATLRIQALRQALDDAPTTIPTVVTSRNPELVMIEKQIATLRQKLHEYTVTFKMTQAHPDVVATRMQIAQLETQLAETDAEIVTQRQTTDNPRRAEMELQLTAAQSEHRAYSDQVQALKQQIEAMSAHSEGVFSVRSTHRKLTRDLSEQQRQMAFWEDNLRRIDMALAAESGNRGVQFDFIQPAEASTRPVSPNLAQVLAAAMILAGASGALAVFLAYRSDETFSGGEALAKQVGLPLLGSVSEIITQQRRRVRTIQRAVLYPTAGAAMAIVLLAAGTLLYVDLEHPEVLQGWKDQAWSLMAAESEPAIAASGSPASPVAAAGVNAPSDLSGRRLSAALSE